MYSMETEMEIIRVTPENYEAHLDLMEMTRTYRQEHLWPIEYYNSQVDAYRDTDRGKTTFVAVSSVREFVGKIGLILCRHCMLVITSST